jgi:Carboxypeptidase regulatory-like domain
MCREAVRRIAILLLAGGCAVAQTSSGSLSGIVSGSDGTPIAAVVTVHGASAARTDSTATGAFSFPNLPPGSYTVCAAPKSGPYLDPCAWELFPPTAQIAAGKAVTGYAVTLRKGGQLQIQLNDPSGLLTTATAAAPGANAKSVLIGVVSARGLFQPLTIVSQSSAGSTQQTVVPFDSPVHLWTSSQNVHLANGSGVQLPAAGVQNTVVLPSAGPSAPISFTVQP